MSKIISLSDFKKNKLLEDDIYSFFSFFDPNFYSFSNDNQLIVVVNMDSSFYFFLEYIESGHFTTSPSVYERYDHLRIHPRISNGEWVVKALVGNEWHDSERFIHTLPETSETDNFHYIYESYLPYISETVH